MWLSANAAPRVGGQGLNLFHMIEGLRESFDLTVFCRGGEAASSMVRVPESKRSNALGRFPLVRRLRDWQTYFSNADFDRFVAARIGPADLFQGATGQCADSLAAAKRHGCRTVVDVVTVHVDDFLEQQRRECARFGVRPTLHRRMRDRILREYEEADLIRVMSNCAARTFAEKGFSPSKIVVATPPMNLNDFEEAKFQESKFRVSFVGLIEPWKGFHYLIDAFNSLKIANGELVLWGGPGSRGVTNYLRRQIAANPRIIVRPVEVRKLGYAEVYGKSSVLVHPSLADGFGYAVAEAMATGIPVITTNRTGASDLIEDGRNGFIVPPADSAGIRDRLEYLAANPSKLRELGRAARETMKELTMERFRANYVRRLQNI
ncbi:MAG TPA: glycosyltransferase family 4 protein [Verrucomicrobiae bacterium]|nr:glycosyltransferase family 4 protein [Verrucomicrobiae bacterium]